LNRPLALLRNAVLASVLLLLACHPSLALGPIDDVLQMNTGDCVDGIGVSFTNGEFNDALALGGQDADEFRRSRFACGSHDVDGRQEYAQCTEPSTFASFAAGRVEPESWVICLVAMVIAEDGRGFTASLDDYEAVLDNGDAVKPDARVSSWAGNYKDHFNVDLSTEQVFSAGSLSYGLLALPDMPNDDFVLKNRETGNQFIVSERENAIGDLIPILAAPEVSPIVMTGMDYGSSPWILASGDPLRVTLNIEEVGNIVSLDAEYRREGESPLPESEPLIGVSGRSTQPEDFGECPPCTYSRTVEFTPEAGKVFHFKVLADGHWTITVEASGSEAPVTPVPITPSSPLTSTPLPIEVLTPSPTPTPRVITLAPTPTATPQTLPTPIPSLTPISSPTSTATPVPTSTPVPTQTPLPTATAIPTSTRTPFPTPTPRAVPPPLPESLPLAHAACFRVEDEGTYSFAELTNLLGGTDDAAAQLSDWGWEGSSYRIFACDDPPGDEVGRVEVNAHRFKDAIAAQQAVDSFAAVRAEGGWLIPGPTPPMGDYGVSLAGPTTNGSEVTVYASQGPVVVRVTGVSADGIPFMNVLAVAQAVVATQEGP
jgi:hypothetical protein